jgi:hypothetical protein
MDLSTTHQSSEVSSVIAIISIIVVATRALAISICVSPSPYIATGTAAVVR